MKEQMALINVDQHYQPTTWINYRLARWLLFLQEDLIDVFGLSRVPLDIRQTVHSVQNYLALPPTEFGPDFGEIDPN